MRSKAFQQTVKMRKPDEIFDLVCFGNYIAGDMKQLIPVEDSREAYQRIKKLIERNYKKSFSLEKQT